jgi:8-oxo-dGTP pyrophosphatase MutT (NUDIX family)
LSGHPAFGKIGPTHTMPAHPPGLIQQLRLSVERFDADGDGAARTARRRILQLLAETPDALDRRHYSPGHVTASGLVLAPDRSAVLLVYHRRLDRWLQPGGHIEPSDESVMSAAMREVFEETGVVTRQDVAPDLINLRIHEIPRSGGEPAHLHFDAVWRFSAANVKLGGGGERHRAVWCDIADLDHYEADEALRRSVALALAT